MKPDEEQVDEAMLRDLHKLLMETHVIEGKLCCANCGHEYQIKEGIANFLLPSHLGEQGCCLATGEGTHFEIHSAYSILV